MNDEELGLPRPEKYEGEQFTVEDYKTEEYAGARTLGEAIAIRGTKAFLKDVTPDDFLDDAPLGVEKIGIADLWSDSTWREGETERDVALERSASSLEEGDLLQVRSCSEDVSEWGYRFHLADGSMVPYEPITITTTSYSRGLSRTFATANGSHVASGKCPASEKMASTTTLSSAGESTHARSRCIAAVRQGLKPRLAPRHPGEIVAGDFFSRTARFRTAGPCRAHWKSPWSGRAAFEGHHRARRRRTRQEAAPGSHAGNGLASYRLFVAAAPAAATTTPWRSCSSPR